MSNKTHSPAPRCQTMNAVSVSIPEEKNPPPTPMLVPNETALAELDLRKMQGEFEGSVQVRKELIKIPRLKINNAMSDSFQAGLGELGEFSCNTHGLVLGKKIKIYPLIVSESASYLDKQTSEIICMSRDMVHNLNGILCRKCPHGEYWNDWGNKANPKTPACKSSIDMIVALKHPETGDFTVMQLSFRKTSYPAGRTIVNLIVGDPRKLPFGRGYTISGRVGKNEKLKKDYWYIDEKAIEKEVTALDDLKRIYPLASQILQLKKAGRIVEESDVDDEATVDESKGPIPF